jgi:phage repressor protein C with HTH and peptisase S24 domain
METSDKIDLITAAFQQLRAAGTVKTQGDFARILGISQSTLSAAKNGDERYLTKSLVERVQALTSPYQQFPSATSILVIPTEAMAGTLGEFSTSIAAYDCERIISPIKDVDYAIKIHGDSMSPEYPSGSLALIKEINEKAFIEWGKVYVLDTVNGVVIKSIRKSERENEVECVSLNPNYQPFRIDKSYIFGWYRVLMVLAMK